jgi:hypothetical protein
VGESNRQNGHAHRTPEADEAGVFNQFIEVVRE